MQVCYIFRCSSKYCDCKECVFTYNISVTVINYIIYLFSGYFKGYVSTKNEMKSHNKYEVSPFYRSHPLTGLVETFSVGLVETCFNYPFAALYAILHFGIDRTNT